ncbi:hypothetical protein JJL56_31870, partial [Azospirillum sp. YIM DDC1]
MPNPTPRDLHVDAVLTNMSVGYVQSQDKFFADKLFPTVQVMKQTDLYTVWPKGAFFRDQVKARPLGGAVPIVGFDTGTASYVCTEYGLGTMIDDRTRANADKPFNPDKASMRLLVGQHLIKRDRIAATTYLKTGVWGTDVAGVNSGPSASQFLRFDQSGHCWRIPRCAVTVRERRLLKRHPHSRGPLMSLKPQSIPPVPDQTAA